MRLLAICLFSLILSIFQPCTALGQGLVVCTTTLIEDWLRQIVDPETPIVTLMPQDADPHAFELSAQDRVKLEKADLIFAHGLGFEGKVFDAMKGHPNLKPIFLSEALKANSPQCLWADPHTWMNPQYVLVMLDSICEALSSYNPSAAELYRERSTQYKGKVQSLDAALSKQLASIEPQKRYLLCQHDNLSHFAERYGFKALASQHCSSEDPSAHQCKHLLKLIAHYHIKAIFYDPREHSTLVQNLANEAHIEPKILIVESLHPNAPSYLELMQYTADTITTTLQE